MALISIAVTEKEKLFQVQDHGFLQTNLTFKETMIFEDLPKEISPMIFFEEQTQKSQLEPSLGDVYGLLFTKDNLWPLRPRRQYPLGFNFLPLGARTLPYSSFILGTAVDTEAE